MAESPMPSPSVSIYAYPWDLHDEGLETASEQLVGCGFNTVHLAFTYHLGTYLLPRNPVRSVYYGNAGAVYFQPELSLYADGAPRPPVAEMVDRNPGYMSELVAALRGAGLKIRAWAVYCYNHALGTAFPRLAKVDALGNAYLAQLCVGNPQVRAYARALTRDIAKNYEVDGLLVETLGYMDYSYGFLNPKTAVEPSPRAAFLLGLCFCPGCRDAGLAAGIDVDRLQREVATWLRGHLNRLPDDEEAAMSTDEEWQEAAFEGELAAFVAVRSKVAASLLAEVLDMFSDIRRDGVLECVNFGGIEEAEARALRLRLDERRIGIAPGAEVATLRKRFEEVRQTYGRDTKVIAAFYPVVLCTEDGFGEALASARAAGADGFRVYNYGLLTERQLSWLRRADWRVEASG